LNAVYPSSTARYFCFLAYLLDTRKGGGPSSIFSISVDATGRRLASAGLDSTIRVWNVEALTKPDEPRLLAAMTRHDGTHVRWQQQQLDFPEFP
jgi:WD40 repeat protein